MFATHLILPTTAALMAYYLYSTKHFGKTGTLFIASVFWLVPRIGLVIAVMRFSEQRKHPDNHLSNMTVSYTDLDPSPVFYGLNGLWISSVVFGILILITAWILRNKSSTFKYLTIAACLSPVLVLIWGAFQISYIIIAIDYVITAYIWGWLLNAFNQSKSASTHVTATNHIGRLSDVAKDVRMQSNDWIAWLSAIISASPSLSKALYRCGVFVTAIFLTIALKWTFHELLNLRLDGSVASWAAIWTVSIMLGMLAFALTSFFDHWNRAIQFAVVTFLCTFSIMICNWPTILVFVGYSEFPSEPLSFVDIRGVFFTAPIVVIGGSLLIATVVLEKHRWMLPFWACWMFIYVFVHAFAANGYYVNDVASIRGFHINGIHEVSVVSNFALFPWINMSVIVFVFLFAIPTYFASERCQGRMLETTPHGPPG